MKLCFSISILAALSATVLGEGTKIGDFVNHHHGIAGTVYAKDEKTLIVKGFTYDGAGPDAFFWAGTQGSPSGVGEILPYPFEGQFYEYEDRSAPILSGSFNGDQEITLTLPEKLKVTDLKWLSVWCRAFSVNFGDLIFPENLVLDGVVEPADEPKSEPEPEQDYTHPKDNLPPPILSEPDNDITNVHNTPRHDQDADALPESEPNAEPETEPSTGYSGASLTSVTNIMTALVAALCWIVL